jgi:hypothetical protein
MLIYVNLFDLSHTPSNKIKTNDVHGLCLDLCITAVAVDRVVTDVPAPVNQSINR